MKQADLNHLRRLLGWVACEIGQSPDEMAAMVTDLVAKIGEPDDEGKKRLVEWHDRSRQVPKYIRSAVKSLRKFVGESGEVVDADELKKRIGRTS